MTAKNSGWPGESKRHHDAKVYGSVSPSPKVKPKYKRKKKFAGDRSLSWIRAQITKRKKGAIGYLFQGQYISVEEGDKIAEGILSKANDAYKHQHADGSYELRIWVPIIYEGEEFNDAINLADKNAFPQPVREQPKRLRLIAGANSIGSMNWGDHGSTAKSQKMVDAWEKALNPLIGKEVYLTGGGGYGYQVGTLTGTERETDPDGTKRLRVKLKDLEGEDPLWGHRKEKSFDPYIGSWQISVTEPMPMTKYKPPKKD